MRNQNPVWALVAMAAGLPLLLGAWFREMGYGALAFGWVLMLGAIFLRTRYHRRRMQEMDR